jgi:hypothetical protein
VVKAAAAALARLQARQRVMPPTLRRAVGTQIFGAEVSRPAADPCVQAPSRGPTFGAEGRCGPNGNGRRRAWSAGQSRPRRCAGHPARPTSNGAIASLATSGSPRARSSRTLRRRSHGSRLPATSPSSILVRFDVATQTQLASIDIPNRDHRRVERAPVVHDDCRQQDRHCATAVGRRACPLRRCSQARPQQLTFRPDSQRYWAQTRKAAGQHTAEQPRDVPRAVEI